MSERPKSILERLLTPFRGDSSRRMLAATVLSITTALLVVDFSTHRYPDYEEGDVAELDVIAQEAFTYQDPEELLQRRAELLDQVHPFFDYDARISSQAQQRLSMAFGAARSSVTENAPSTELDKQIAEVGLAEPSAVADQAEIVEQTEKHSATQLELERAADLHLSAPHRETMIRVLWSIELEQLTLRLLDEMFQSYIVASSAYMPKENQSFTVQRMFSDSGQNNDEIVLQDARSIKTLDDSRQFLSVIATTQQATSGQEISPMVRDLALVLARETLQPNLIYNHQ